MRPSFLWSSLIFGNMLIHRICNVMKHLFRFALCNHQHFLELRLVCEDWSILNLIKLFSRFYYLTLCVNILFRRWCIKVFLVLLYFFLSKSLFDCVTIYFFILRLLFTTEENFIRFFNVHSLETWVWIRFFITYKSYVCRKSFFLIILLIPS